jgi:3-oxo-5-alpha-steroid 4-dehydrogenase 1
MSERAVFDCILWGFSAVGVATFVALLFVVAPYGRHLRRGFGPSVNGRLGWVLMEATAAIVPPATFALAGAPSGPLPWIFLALWEVHYLYRAFIYPFRRPTAGQLPALVVGSGMLFNLINGWLNGRWLSHFAPPMGLGWLASPRFLGGLVLFLAGWAINQHSDQVLIDLRARGQGYAIPQRGLHRLVASPNYLGELIEWCGYALLTWSPAAAVFVLWTAANLVPRALANLRWYRTTFPDYPRGRRALVPYLL